MRNLLFLSFLPLRSPFSAAPPLLKPGVQRKTRASAPTLVNNPHKSSIEVKLCSCRIYFRSLQKYTEDSKRKTGKSFRVMRQNAHRASFHETRNTTKMTSRVITYIVNYSYQLPYLIECFMVGIIRDCPQLWVLAATSS